MKPSEFKFIRKSDLGMSQDRLATELEVSKDTISNIERSMKRVPRIYELSILHTVWLHKVKPIILELL